MVSGIFDGAVRENPPPAASDCCMDSRHIENYLGALMAALDRHTLISMTDRDGRIIYVNERMCKVTGYDSHELIGEDHRILNSGHHPPDFFEKMWAHLNSGLTWSGQIKNLRKNGDNCWIHTTITPVFDYRNELVGFISVRTDISGQKRAEERLKSALGLEKKAQKRLMEAINAMHGGVTIFDKHGLLIAGNDNLVSIYPQLDKMLKPGTPIEDMLRALHPKLTETQLEARKDKVMNAAEDEIRLLPTGNIIKISRSRTRNGDVIALNTDITDYVEKERRLQQKANKLKKALEKEKELNNMQRQFVSMASHEFRTPLAIIDGAAQRLYRRRENLDGEEVSKRVTKIRRSVQRMTNLMESTLSAARMDAGKVVIKITDCNIAELLESACQRQQEIAVNHKISLKLRELPETIRCDEGAIGQVMTNLLSNAVKYSPGSPDILVEGRVEAANILISITDNGLGIDAEDLPRLFERFFRAGTSTGIAGTGIGLNLARLLVREHGGNITLQSEKGKGSCFTVKLPIADPQSVDMKKQAMASAKGGK